MVNNPHQIEALMNVSDAGSLMIWNNTATHGMFGLALILILFSISFISMLGFGFKRSLTASLWLSSLTSVVLWVLQLVNADIMTAIILITGLSTIFLFKGD